MECAFAKVSRFVRQGSSLQLAATGIEGRRPCQLQLPAPQHRRPRPGSPLRRQSWRGAWSAATWRSCLKPRSGEASGPLRPVRSSACQSNARPAAPSADRGRRVPARGDERAESRGLAGIPAARGRQAPWRPEGSAGCSCNLRRKTALRASIAMPRPLRLGRMCRDRGFLPIREIWAPIRAVACKRSGHACARGCGIVPIHTPLPPMKSLRESACRRPETVLQCHFSPPSGRRNARLHPSRHAAGFALETCFAVRRRRVWNAMPILSSLARLAWVVRRLSKTNSLESAPVRSRQASAKRWISSFWSFVQTLASAWAKAGRQHHGRGRQ